MKSVKRWIFVGVMVAGLSYGHGSLRAQPASELVPADAAPAHVDGDPARTEDEPTVLDDPDKPWNRGVSMEARVAAREIFLEGYKLADHSAYRSAAEKFTAALATWKHPAFYYNLGLAQFYLGQEVEARENLERSLEYGEEPLGAEYFQKARTRLDEVKRRLGRIRVICRTPGAEVTLNGSRLFTGPGSHEGWTRASIHELTAKKSGHQSEARQVAVRAGELLEVDLSLLTLSQATDSNRRWAAWKPWAVVGTGMAIAAAGGGLHRLSTHNFNAYDEAFSMLPCAQSRGCTTGEVEAELDGQLNRARRQQAVALGAYIGGGALIATGVVLLYLNRPRLGEQGDPGASRRRVAVAPAVSHDMLGVLASVSH